MAVQKKKFFEIEVPLTGDSSEAYALNLEDLDGRNLKLDLTRMFKGKGVEVGFSVSVKDGKAIASPRRLRLLPYYIRRTMRKRTSYVEDSFVTDCKDSQMRIKPFLITRKRVSRAVRNALRVEVIQYLKEYLKDKSSDEVFDEVLNSRMQKPMLLRLKKVYPLAFCEIRHMEVVDTSEK